jgi:tetratricopeptide (TPR) repeat protein
VGSEMCIRDSTGGVHFVHLDIDQQDITGDGIPEISLRNHDSYTILGCQGGKYIPLYHNDGEHHQVLLDQDLSADGIPDLVLGENYCANCTEMEYRILAWDGRELADQIQPSEYQSPYNTISIGKNGYGQIQVLGSVDYINGWDAPDIRDVNGDDIKEILLSGGIPSGEFTNDGSPWRIETVAIGWNGTSFSVVDWSANLPLYRFQAIQDGDVYTSLGKYAEALNSYQNAIFNDRLEYWSAERMEYERLMLTFDPTSVTNPSPTKPGPDPAEYPNLAAYAHFKIMLVHILQGHTSTAQTVYETLLNEFSVGKEGSIYADLARLFWEEYQVSQDLGAACALVTQQVASQPETYLEYLGNREDVADELFGWWSLSYKPEDVCPLTQR